MKNKSKKIAIFFSSKWFLFAIVSFGILSFFYGDRLSKEVGKEVIGKLLILLGSTAISAGAISFLVEISSIKKIIRDDVIEVIEAKVGGILAKDLDFHGYLDEDFNKIRIRSVAKKYNMDEKDVDNTIYKLEPYLVNLVNKKHYIEHNSRIEIKECKSKNSILKNIKTDLIISTFTQENNSYELKINAISHNLTTREEILDNFKIIAFNVDKVNKIKKVRNFIKILEMKKISQDKVSYILKLKYPLFKTGIHHISIEYEYLIDMDDVNANFKLLYPCRKMQHTVIVNEGEKWDLSIEAFASFGCSGYSISDNYKVDVKTNKVQEIIFNDWVIPGAGYAIFLKEIC